MEDPMHHGRSGMGLRENPVRTVERKEKAEFEPGKSREGPQEAPRSAVLVFFT
jgi:hypothetical protein